MIYESAPMTMSSILIQKDVHKQVKWEKTLIPSEQARSTLLQRHTVHFHRNMFWEKSFVILFNIEFNVLN